MPNQSVGDVQEVLNAFEEVARQEREALVRLDIDDIDRCADTKERLAGTLRAKEGELAKHHTQQLGRVLRQLRLNQVLLVHARDHARGALALMGVGEGQSKYGDSTPAQRARLNVRG